MSVQDKFKVVRVPALNAYKSYTWNARTLRGTLEQGVG